MGKTQSLKFLVVDDQVYMLQMISHVLTMLGYEDVTTCDDAERALKLIDDGECVPQLILLDLNMPKMDGVEFIRQLVDRHFDGGLILVSAEDNRVIDTVAKLAREHKFNVLGQLAKPVIPDALKSMINKWQLHDKPRRRRDERKSYDANDIAGAIRQQQLINYYQPKVAIPGGELIGVEALVRWQHPQDGLVLPDQFVAVAEASGLIDELTAEVFAVAVKQAAIWAEEFMPVCIAVNVSMDNLSSLKLPDIVSSLLAESNVSTQLIQLEVTESRLMQDAKSVLDVLTRLRLKRFELAIDDFGTGHSSMAQLRNIPFDLLKIDQSFVHQAYMEPTAHAIYTGSLAIARELGMKVVAEGVEDKDDWDFLCATQCDIAQGYFVAKPMLPEKIPQWLKEWNAKIASSFS